MGKNVTHLNLENRTKTTNLTDILSSKYKLAIKVLFFYKIDRITS